MFYFLFSLVCKNNKKSVYFGKKRPESALHKASDEI